MSTSEVVAVGVALLVLANVAFVRARVKRPNRMYGSRVRVRDLSSLGKQVRLVRRGARR